MTNEIKCLDYGFVRLVAVLGSDATVANAARASFNKHSYDLTDADERLIKGLTRSDPPHLSPFRHVAVQFEISAPLIVARQLWRYITGAASEGGHDELLAWNEGSYRYMSKEFHFYTPQPGAWRSAPVKAKLGSGGVLPTGIGEEATAVLRKACDNALEAFTHLRELGVAAEQARLALPSNALYTNWVMTISLQGLSHLLTERLDGHTMAETRTYADAMLQLALPKFPVSLAALLGFVE